jgi:hypothetical protein
LHLALDNSTRAIGGIIVNDQYVHLVLHGGTLLLQGIDEGANVVMFIIGWDDDDNLYRSLPLFASIVMRCSSASASLCAFIRIPSLPILYLLQRHAGV